MTTERATCAAMDRIYTMRLETTMAQMCWKSTVQILQSYYDAYGNVQVLHFK